MTEPKDIAAAIMGYLRAAFGDQIEGISEELAETVAEVAV